MITVRVRGMDEARAKLKALGAKGDALLDPAVQAGALVIENAAKGFAPYKSGTLRRSITSEKSGISTRSGATRSASR